MDLELAAGRLINSDPVIYPEQCWADVITVLPNRLGRARCKEREVSALGLCTEHYQQLVEGKS